MTTIETTPGCNATPRILLALEELGEAYEIVVKDDGYFMDTYGGPGPALVEKGFRLLSGNPILRYLGRTRSPGTLMPADARGQAEVDYWLDFLVLRVGMSVAQGQMEAAIRYLGVLDRQLEGREWLCGAFTAADCGASFPLIKMSERLPLQTLPRLREYLARIAARPAWGRAMQKLATSLAQGGAS